MSLGLEPPEVDIMERPPRRPQEGVLSIPALVLICVQGMFIGGSSLAVYAHAVDKEGYDVQTAQSLALVFLTAQQLVLAFMSRSLTTSIVRTGVMGNRWLVGAVALSFVLMVAGNYLPGLNHFLDLVPLSGLDWAKILGGCVALLVLNELLKLLLRHRWWDRRWWQSLGRSRGRRRPHDAVPLVSVTSHAAHTAHFEAHDEAHDMH